MNISTGGQSAVSLNNTTISIRPQITNSVLDLKSLTLCFKFQQYDTVPAKAELCYPINGLALFRPVAVKIGNFVKNYAYSGELCQGFLEQNSAMWADKQALGIGAIENFDQGFQFTGNDGNPQTI